MQAIFRFFFVYLTSRASDTLKVQTNYLTFGNLITTSDTPKVQSREAIAVEEYLLTELSSSNEIRGEVRSEAVGLSKRLKELDNSILLQVWNMVLERVYKTSVQLQKERLPINVAVNLLQSLLEFIESLRGRFDEFEKSAIEMCGIPSYRDEEKGKRS